VDKLYLCAYGDESFVVYASSLEQAHQKAYGLGTTVVRELNENEYEGLWIYKNYTLIAVG